MEWDDEAAITNDLPLSWAPTLKTELQFLREHWSSAQKRKTLPNFY